MKKIISTLAFPILLSSASAVFAADGTLNFTGQVTTVACSVDAASSSQTIALGTVSATSFPSAGSVASATKFNIKLSTCPESITAATVRFDGTPNTTDSRLLGLTSDQTAKGLAVAFYEADGSTLIPLQTASMSKTIDSKSTVNELSYIAKYMSVSKDVTAGTANASANFTVSYN